MKYALFLGCTIPARLLQYESASRAVLDELDVGVVDIKEFNCCGYPLRNINFKAFVLLSARNLALAEQDDLDIITLCQCCFGSLKKANHLLKEDVLLRNEVNSHLEKEGLRYTGGIEVKHLLQVLYHDVGIAAIQKEVKRMYEGLQIAAHYGCHILRPSQVVQFDNPLSPMLFDQLIEITGAQSIYWPLRLECCGAPVRGINDELSLDLSRKKIEDGRQRGAQYLCVACPYCQIQFDTVQGSMPSKGGKDHQLPSILYPQLLGLCMGINEKILGLGMNRIPLDSIKDFLSDTREEPGTEAEAAYDKGVRRNVAC
jgi:heterodisulfide reductase subunit B